MGKMRLFSGITIIVMVLVVGVGSAMAAPLKTNLYGLDGLFMATGDR